MNDTQIAAEDALAKMVFNDFLYWRTKTNFYAREKQGGRPIRDPAYTPEKRLQMMEYLAWCRASHIDPRFFIFCLYAARNWMFTVKFDHLRSEKVLARLKVGHFKENEPYRTRITRAPVVVGDAPESMKFNPLVDMSAETESRKLRLHKLGLSSTCIKQVGDFEAPTYGFHPKSKVCASCPLQAECRSELAKRYPFDVVALRKGEITLEQAHLIAAHVH